jgi:hypothetical protein
MDKGPDLALLISHTPAAIAGGAFSRVEKKNFRDLQFATPDPGAIDAFNRSLLSPAYARFTGDLEGPAPGRLDPLAKPSPNDSYVCI